MSRLVRRPTYLGSCDPSLSYDVVVNGGRHRLATAYAVVLTYGAAAQRLGAHAYEAAEVIGVNVDNGRGIGVEPTAGRVAAELGAAPATIAPFRIDRFRGDRAVPDCRSAITH